MKKSGIITIVVIVIVVLGLGGWYLATRNKTNNTYGANTTSSSNNMGTMNMSHNSSSSSSSQSVQATNAVTIQNFAFSPPSITVKEGTKVTWTNKDSVAHTVTEIDGQSGPNSGDVSPNGTYSFVFDKTGTFHYHCSVHPEMVGTVTVTNP